MFCNSALDLGVDVGDAGVEMAPAAHMGRQARVPAPAASRKVMVKELASQ